MTDRELHEAITAAAQAILAERAVLNRLASRLKSEGSERQNVINRAATLVDDCAGALEELCFDLED